MDTFSHYLWTVPLYWQHSKRWLLGLVGAAPDLLSFGLLILVNLVTGVRYQGGPPPLASMPSWVPIMYDLTHSLVVCLVVLGLLWLWKPAVPLLLLGWPLHILIDLPTHTTHYFPTPLLWPLSDWTFNGFSWATPWFFFLTWASLLGVYTWLGWRAYRARTAV